MLQVCRNLNTSLFFVCIQDVRNLLQLAPVRTFDDEEMEEGHVVSTEWLEEMVGQVGNMTCIDNTSLVCCHTNTDGNACLDPRKMSLAKRITSDSWSLVQVGEYIPYIICVVVTKDSDLASAVQTTPSQGKYFINFEAKS